MPLFSMHRSKTCSCKRQLQPICHGNAVIVTDRVVTLESCALLQDVYEVMGGKYDTGLALPGQG